MSIDEQLEIISSYKQGKTVYTKHKFDNRDESWRVITGEHCFDFESNHYAIEKPKYWIETLCDEVTDMNLALTKTIDHLNGGGFRRLFTTDITMKIDDQKVDTQEVIFLKDVYKLWNIAVQYGRANSGSELITEENNILKKR